MQIPKRCTCKVHLLCHLLCFGPYHILINTGYVLTSCVTTNVTDKRKQETEFRKISVFWDTMPSFRLNVNRRFGRICLLHLQGLRISEKQVASYGCVCRRSVDFQQTIRHCILEDRTLHNLKSYRIKKEQLTPFLRRNQIPHVCESSALLVLLSTCRTVLECC
jgi:hypothetical protein